MDTLIHNKQQQENICKGFYLDTPENRKLGRVGRGYDSDAGANLSQKELVEKFGKPVVKPKTGTAFTVKTGDAVFFEREGKRFVGRITRYPSNDKIEVNYGAVVIKKEEIVGANGKLFGGVESKETNELMPMGQEAGSTDERALRVAEKLKLEKEIQAFKEILKTRALHSVSTPIAEFDTYSAKLKRWKQLGGKGTGLYGFTSKEDVDISAPVEDLEEADKIRRSIPKTLTSVVDKVKDTLAEHFDVDTVTAYRNDFMKSPLYREALKGGFDEGRLIAAFEEYSSSFFAPRGVTSIF